MFICVHPCLRYLAYVRTRPWGTITAIPGEILEKGMKELEIQHPEGKLLKRDMADRQDCIARNDMII